MYLYYCVSVFSFDRHALELLDKMLTLDPSQVSVSLACMSFLCLFQVRIQDNVELIFEKVHSDVHVSWCFFDQS